MIPGTPRPPRARAGQEGCPARSVQAPAGRAAGGDFRGDSPDERPPLGGDLTQFQIPQGQVGAGRKGLSPGPLPAPELQILQLQTANF